MAELYFPELASGALAQYPILKTRSTRTIRNVLPGGDMILKADQRGGSIIWQLGYNGLTIAEVNGLTNFFAACQGRLHAFTFIDPTDNMLVSSSDLGGGGWLVPTGVSFAGGIPDPNGGSTGILVTNNTQLYQEITQTAPAPSSYQYCFSLYARSATLSTITIFRSGANARDDASQTVDTEWARLNSSGRLTDAGSSLTVGVGLAAGQQISIFGIQLEAQREPSRYRPTFQGSGVYLNAHWGVDDLPISADAPNLFSTAFSIETTT